MKKIIALAALLFLALAAIASAQTGGVTVTPMVERGTYSRTFTYDNVDSGYRSTGLRSGVLQKGFEAQFRGTGRWSSKMRYMIGTLEEPTGFYQLTDGRTGTNPYNAASNATVHFSGRSRLVEFTEEYRRGIWTYCFGIGYRLLDHTDAATIFSPDSASYSESEFHDHYFAPMIGLTAKQEFGRVHVSATINAQPLVWHSGTYDFRPQGFSDSHYRGSTLSRAADVRLEAGVTISKNFGVVAGWNYSVNATPDTSFLLPNPYGTKTPQGDSWRGIYIGLQVR